MQIVKRFTDYILLKGKAKEDIVKYLNEIPSTKMQFPIIVWACIFNIIAIPFSLWGADNGITKWLLLLIIPLDLWTLVLYALFDKLYKIYTLWLGVKITIFSLVVLMIGITILGHITASILILLFATYFGITRV